MRSFLLLLTLSVLAACSPSKLMERGNLDQAFERAARQLERNPSRKADVGSALAAAYEGLQSRDYAQANRLRNSGRADRWEAVVDKLDRCVARQRRFEAIRTRSKRIIQVVTEREPNYLAEQEVASRNAAAHLLAVAEQQLALGRRGDVFAARAAHGALERRRTYAAANGRTRSLSREALTLGTVFLAVDVAAATFALEDPVEQVTLEYFQGPWRQVRPLGAYQPGDKLDFVVELDVDRPYVSPVVSNTEKDRFSRKLTENVKVGVDSAGVAVYKQREKTVRATVLTTTLEREASLGGRLAIVRYATNQAVRELPLRGTARFLGSSARLRGDRAALGDSCPPFLDEPRVIPPDDLEMVSLALGALLDDLPRINFDDFLSTQALALN